MSDTPLTTAWLRANGFKWHQLELQPSRHWVLWIGDCLPDSNGDGRRSWYSNEDFGIEVARGDATGSWWFVWFRADYAGRYSRFLCAGHIQTAEQLTGMIAGITGLPFDPQDSLFGSLRRPEVAARLREEDSRFDLVLARDKDKTIAREESYGIKRMFGSQSWFNRVEVEDDRSVVVYVNRWPTYEERKGMPATAAIECWPEV